MPLGIFPGTHPGGVAVLDRAAVVRTLRPAARHERMISPRLPRPRYVADQARDRLYMRIGAFKYVVWVSSVKPHFSATRIDE
jgi:hypothetical protein